MMMSSKELLVEISKGVLIAIIFVSLTFTTNPAMAAQDDNDQIDNYEIGAMYIEHYLEYADLWTAPIVTNDFVERLIDHYLGYEAFIIHDAEILNTYWYNSDYYPTDEYPHMDSADLFFFAGHGDKYEIPLWNQTFENVDPTPLTGNTVDFDYLYLHTDLEWAFIVSCDTLNVSDDEIDSLRLSIQSGGLHSMLGMHSPIFVTTDFGKYLADKLSVWSTSIWQAWKTTIHEKSKDGDDLAAIVYAYVLKFSSGVPVSRLSPRDVLSGRVGPNFGGYITIDYRNEDINEPYIDPTAHINAVVYVYLYWEDVIQ
ncbi:MAG TPA: hypothetical protein ENF35_00730 [Aciduliprofundum sp.]|nr:hypothetical protein [Aciduliprofundum sp.]